VLEQVVDARPTSYLHTIAKFIDERVNPKVLLERISPALSRGLGSRLPTEQRKHSGLHQSLRPWRQQTKVAHGVLASVQDML
jgi:hypothetical protein